MLTIPAATTLITIIGIEAIAWMSPSAMHAAIYLGVLCALCFMVTAVTQRATAPDVSRPDTHDLQVWTETRGIRALVVGAGTVGRALADSLEADGKYFVVGFIDDHM